MDRLCKVGDVIRSDHFRSIPKDTEVLEANPDDGRYVLNGWLVVEVKPYQPFQNGYSRAHRVEIVFLYANNTRPSSLDYRLWFYNNGNGSNVILPGEITLVEEVEIGDLAVQQSKKKVIYL